MKRYLLIICLLAIFKGFSQKMPETGMNVRIIEPEKTIVAEIRPVSSKPDMGTSAIFYWYGSGTIHHTQGGYSGTLLNGTYTEYFPDKNLSQRGTFEKGLKTGTWKNWASGGLLKEWYTYRKGQRSGDFEVFDDNGKLVQSGRYSADVLDGKFTAYVKDQPVVSYYKNGVLQTGSQKPSFWSRLPLFKKKATAPDQKKKP